MPKRPEPAAARASCAGWPVFAAVLSALGALAALVALAAPARAADAAPVIVIDKALSVNRPVDPAASPPVVPAATRNATT